MTKVQFDLGPFQRKGTQIILRDEIAWTATLTDQARFFLIRQSFENTEYISPIADTRKIWLRMSRVRPCSELIFRTILMRRSLFCKLWKNTFLTPFQTGTDPARLNGTDYPHDEFSFFFANFEFWEFLILALTVFNTQGEDKMIKSSWDLRLIYILKMKTRSK